MGQDPASAARPDTPPSTDTPAEPAVVATLRHNRNFRLLWTGQILSDIGSEFGVLAYPLLILALTRSPLIAGAVGTITSGMAFLVRLPAGALADRYDLRRTMIICDGVRAVVLGLLAGLVAVHEIVWPVVLGVAIIDRVGDTMFTPASVAALPRIVGDKQLESSWAANEARQYAASLSGPALGGLLFSLGRAIPFLGDTVSYGVSVVTSARMSADFSPKTVEGGRKGLWSEAFDGVHLIWRDPLLRAVIIQAPLINFAFTGVIFTITIGLRQHGTSPALIGVTQAGIAIGGLLGAIAAPKIQGRWSMSRLVVALTGGGMVCMVVGSLVMPSPFVAFAIALPLLLSPTTNAALFSALLRRTPEHMRGRVNNALLQVATGLAALSPLVAGLFVQHFSSNWAMGSFAAVMGVSTILALTLKGLRQAEAADDKSAEATPPQAEPDREPVGPDDELLESRAKPLLPE